MPGRLHWFAFYAPKEELRGKRPQLHKTRDGAAFAQLAGALCGHCGFKVGDIILNHPEAANRDFDYPFEKGDLLLVTTRPPLDDSEEGDARRVEKSGTALEGKIFGVFRKYFKTCSRSRIELSDGIARRMTELGLPWRERANVAFRMNAGAGYSGCADTVGQWTPHPRADLTAAYLIYCTDTWAEGPALLGAFAMGGTETMMWGATLARRYSSVLQELTSTGRNTFIMVEFGTPTMLQPDILPAVAPDCDALAIARIEL
jgi:hypothetical protein